MDIPDREDAIVLPRRMTQLLLEVEGAADRPAA